MSQQKVDHYKEQKANRKKIVEKERRNRKLWKAVAILILVLVIAGIGTGVGLTIRNQYIKAQNAKPDYSTSSLVVSDMAGILETDSETESAESDTADESSESEETSEETTSAEETTPADTEAEN